MKRRVIETATMIVTTTSDTVTTDIAAITTRMIVRTIEIATASDAGVTETMMSMIITTRTGLELATALAAHMRSLQDSKFFIFVMAIWKEKLLDQVYFISCFLFHDSDTIGGRTAGIFGTVHIENQKTY